MTGRPSTGSSTPGATAVETTVGPVQWAPPSEERNISCTRTPLRTPTPRTEALPWLSVRIVHPSGCWLMPLSVAGPTWFAVHVAAPSPEVATVSVGNAWPWLLLRNEAQHTYARPKNGLAAALSTQTCSLSENVEDCFEITTGAGQAEAVPAAAACGLSVQETAIASNPPKVSSDRVALKLEVRLA